jgi:uncharacterized protein with PIN domain
MSSCQEDLEIRLLKQAHTAIGKLLDQKGGRQDLSLIEMEDLVGDFEVNLRQTVLQEWVNEIPAQDVRICHECGGKLRYKGQKTKRVETVRGEVEVERDYYHCAECGRGYFPPR